MNADSDTGGCVMTHHVHRVAVLGAGTMGAAVAAHAANAGLLVDLLDIVPSGAKGKERNSIVKVGFERMLKAKPAALMHESLAEHIRLGNFEDDFERLKEADWILEAIIERLEPKQELMARIEQVAKAGAIISSNTSGIPLANVAEGRSEAFKRRFLGAHFFNASERSEEHTSELQSLAYLVCRLLLEKKKRAEMHP